MGGGGGSVGCRRPSAAPPITPPEINPEIRSSRPKIRDWRPTKMALVSGWECEIRGGSGMGGARRRVREKVATNS